MASIPYKTLKVEYDPNRHPQLIKYMVRSGVPTDEIASEIGIARRSLMRWQAEYPEVRAAFKENRFWVDHLVEESLLKRALGYEYEEVMRKQVFAADAQEPATTDVTDLVERKITKKHMAPDVQACIFWLKNRQPERWRDILQHQHTGELLKEQTKTKRKTVRQVVRDPESLRLANALARRVSLNAGSVGEQSVN